MTQRAAVAYVLDRKVSAAYGYTSPQKSLRRRGVPALTLAPITACGEAHAAACSFGSTRRHEVNTEETPERRLTPTERLHEVTMAALTRAPAPPEHAVELSRNAKGVAQFTVTVRGHDLAVALEQAQTSYDQLVEKYPYEVGS